jgi:Holliday junction resolvasome RuvABC ATP-dependent DNA helicase subunit
MFEDKNKKKLDKMVQEFLQPKKSLLLEMVEEELEGSLSQLAQQREVAARIEDVAHKAASVARLQRSLIGDVGGLELKKEEKENVVEDVVPIVIDLGMVRSKQLDESWMYMLSGWIETLLGGLFGLNNIPATIKGTKQEIESFAKTMQGEKKYIESWHRYGLDDARTHGSKIRLDNAIRDFEKTTGIKYPFKG